MSIAVEHPSVDLHSMQFPSYVSQVTRAQRGYGSEIRDVYLALFTCPLDTFD